MSLAKDWRLDKYLRHLEVRSEGLCVVKDEYSLLCCRYSVAIANYDAGKCLSRPSTDALIVVDVSLSESLQILRIVPYMTFVCARCRSVSALSQLIQSGTDMRRRLAKQCLEVFQVSDAVSAKPEPRGIMLLWRPAEAAVPLPCATCVFARGQAVVLVADSKISLKVTGHGDVLSPHGGAIGDTQTAD